MKAKTIYISVASIIGLLLIGLIIGFSYQVTNGFQNNVPSFLLFDSNNKLIINGSSQILNFKKENKIKVTGLTQEQITFNIYGSKNFCYTVNGTERNFSEVTQSLNSYFDVKIENYEISIYPKFLASEIVDTLYDNIVIIDDLVKENGNYFIANTTVGKENYNFYFMYDLATDLNISETEIIF